MNKSEGKVFEMIVKDISMKRDSRGTSIMFSLKKPVDGWKDSPKHFCLYSWVPERFTLPKLEVLGFKTFDEMSDRAYTLAGKTVLVNIEGGYGSVIKVLDVPADPHIRDAVAAETLDFYKKMRDVLNHRLGVTIGIIEEIGEWREKS